MKTPDFLWKKVISKYKKKDFMAHDNISKHAIYVVGEVIIKYKYLNGKYTVYPDRHDIKWKTPQRMAYVCRSQKISFNFFKVINSNI